MNNKLIATIGCSEVQVKRLGDKDKERIAENKRIMREFIKKKCKKKGADYGRYKERNC